MPRINNENEEVVTYLVAGLMLLQGYVINVQIPVTSHAQDTSAESPQDWSRPRWQANGNQEEENRGCNMSAARKLHDSSTEIDTKQRGRRRQSNATNTNDAYRDGMAAETERLDHDDMRDESDCYNDAMPRGGGGRRNRGQPNGTTRDNTVEEMYDSDSNLSDTLIYSDEECLLSDDSDSDRPIMSRRRRTWRELLRKKEQDKIK